MIDGLRTKVFIRPVPMLQEEPKYGRERNEASETGQAGEEG